MGVAAERRPTDDDEPHLTTKECLDLFKYQLVDDGSITASLVPRELVVQAKLKHFLKRWASFFDRVRDVFVDPKTYTYTEIAAFRIF